VKANDILSFDADLRCVFLDLGNLASYLLNKQLVARHTMRSVQTNENQFQFGRTPIVTLPAPVTRKAPITFVLVSSLHSIPFFFFFFFS
jgi:hypothetical protein